MSKKGKLDRHPVWVVTIKMPKTLIADIYTGYNDAIESMKEPTTQVQQPVDVNQEQELDTDLDTI
jgi:hypothetical protein